LERPTLKRWHTAAANFVSRTANCPQSLAMAISLKTRKMLWGRSGGMCAICRVPLFEDESESDDPSIVGEECHIVAREKEGPRGSDQLAEEKRDLYENLILLCLKDHKIIDDQPAKYTVEVLHRLKAEHLKWFQESTGRYDLVKQKDIEAYADIADGWAQQAALDDWGNLTYSLLSADQPLLTKADDQRLEELQTWLFTRVWPMRLEVLEHSFENFGRVLADLLGQFRKHAIIWGETLITNKFYQSNEWNQERYEKLAREYDHHVGMVQDLTIELTRAANLVCDRIRETLSHGFRRTEGIVLARQGMDTSGHVKQLKMEYEAGEREGIPYPGVEDFVHARTTRSFYYGDRYFS
jgi:hypothetical protein